MDEKQFDNILKRLQAIENTQVTIKSMILSLAEKTGFEAEDIMSNLADLRKQALSLDPRPNEADLEQAVR